MPDTQVIAPNNTEFLSFIKDMRKESRKKNTNPDKHISELRNRRVEELKGWMLRKSKAC